MKRTEKRIGTKYDYSFVVWPSETWGFSRALFEAFAYSMAGSR